MRSGIDAKYIVNEVLGMIRDPLNDKRQFPVIAMCALIAAEDARRQANSKPPLNCKVIDISDDDKPFYTAEFINSLRTKSADGEYIKSENMRAIIKNGGHYFVVAFEFSPNGNKFVVLDAAGEKRGDSCYKNLCAIDTPGQNNIPYFSEHTLSTGSKYENSEFDLNSWYIQKNGIDCPAFSLEHAFQLSKMPNFFNDVKKHAFVENYITKVGWIYLAKKLVRGAQSKRWLQAYNKLHPDTEIDTNQNSIESIFAKHQQHAAEYLTKMLDSHDAEYVLSNLLMPILIIPRATEQAITYESTLENERDNIKQHIENLRELREIFLRLSPDDIRIAMSEFPDIKNSIDAMSSLQFSLLNGLEEIQMKAVCESLFDKFADPESDLINNAFDFNIAMSHLSDKLQSRLYTFLEPKITTFDFSDPEDFVDVAKHVPTEKLSELCQLFGIDKIKQHIDTDKFSDLSSKARYVIKNMISPPKTASMPGLLFSTPAKPDDKIAPETKSPNPNTK